MTMGIKGLPALMRDKALRKTPAGTLVCAKLKGLKLGIDTSTFLHAALGSQDSADDFNAQPPIPVEQIVEYLETALALFKNAEVTPVFFFDGCRHIHKAATDASRSSAAAVKSGELKALLAAGHPADYNAVRKLRKQSVFVREDIVAEAVQFLRSQNVEIRGAPYEAEWQLVAAELAGEIAGIISVDSDVFTLGGKLLIYDLQVKGDGPCNVLERDVLLQKSSAAAIGTRTTSWRLACSSARTTRPAPTDTRPTTSEKRSCPAGSGKPNLSMRRS
jgi:hypothetical protein